MDLIDRIKLLDHEAMTPAQIGLAVDRSAKRCREVMRTAGIRWKDAPEATQWQIEKRRAREERLDRLRGMNTPTMTLREIGRALGISSDTAGAYCAELGVEYKRLINGYSGPGLLPWDLMRHWPVRDSQPYRGCERDGARYG